MKMNISSETIRLHAITQPGTSLAFGFLAFSWAWVSSIDASAENFSAFMPNDMA